MGLASACVSLFSANKEWEKKNHTRTLATRPKLAPRGNIVVTHNLDEQKSTKNASFAQQSDHSGINNGIPSTDLEMSL